MLVDAGASLIIEGDGALKVTGADSNAAGIGVQAGAELVVNSGTIEASSNGGHAGIGDYDGGSVVINGGTVRACGGHHVSWNAYDGAGIGGAWDNGGCGPLRLRGARGRFRGGFRRRRRSAERVDRRIGRGDCRRR